MKNSSKCDGKLMGPLFPRLHVNDTEKGSPRGPPRNKMALYEQLSIPSQRFRTSIDKGTDKESMPPARTGQENVHDSHIFFSVQAPESRHAAENPLKSYAHQDAPVLQVERQKKLDEDDFSVPIFLHSKKDQYDGKYYHSAPTGKLSPSNQVHSQYSMTHQGSSDEIANKQVKNNTGRQNKTSSKDTVASDRQEAFRYSMYSNEEEHLLHQQNAYEQRHGSLGNLSGTKMADCRLLKEQRANFIDYAISAEPLYAGLVYIQRLMLTVKLLLSYTCADAMTYIYIQQRAFAIQVFELHKLIKVQKLIAESPHLLLEDIGHIAKSVVSSDVKKLPLEYIIKPPSNISKHRSDFERTNRKRDRSAENVGNASLSSVQKDSQPSEYKRFSSRVPLAPNAGEPHMGSWSSYPSQAHQWLIPVMSPTEGLVYKPYSGHGFTGPVYGGPGAPCSTPGSGNFQPPGYGVLASHHQYPGMGGPPYIPPANPHGYFPPYSMPVTNAVSNNHNVDHMDHPTMQSLQRQMSGGGANFSVQRQDSLRLPSQNSGADFTAMKSNEPIASEVQISTASSPVEKAQAQSTVLDNTIEGNNPPSHFDIPSITTNGPKGDQQARVIRVVPHNRRSATESVARIFRSIQEERKHLDSA
ncbi:hypothetical protein Leryth_004955 [Lithospermum erythrorhizon]|nr:hypothetical protein Leryth_004955 [Lithospermum erythrorhizon]